MDKSNFEIQLLIFGDGWVTNNKTNEAMMFRLRTIKDDFARIFAVWPEVKDELTALYDKAFGRDVW